MMDAIRKGGKGRLFIEFLISHLNAFSEKIVQKVTHQIRKGEVGRSPSSSGWLPFF